ncbi:2-hydroxyisoflavanone dehydratase [Artemisia annua]|uniref:2-hydroxyisoflavanone dehydratase n=1 Tax=Artemisia annua TaxID=35608 RepID=A0A2U1MZB7_ARTAN|nr:2-hydroxyisoflavanone dehydratase [Artemisia annua]
MASNDKEIVIDLVPFLRTYKNGTVERLISSPYLPPSPENNPTDGVCSKDITISPHVSARIYLPSQALTTTNKLPVLVYYHGGGFCLESAFCALFHSYVNSIVSKSQSIIAISVEYILAPENPLPAAYEDSWVALNWVTSHFDQETYPKNKDQWLLDFANFHKLYIGGDSAGGNIAHNMAIRAGIEKLKGGVKIHGAFLSHPHFWGSKAIRSEPSENRDASWLSRVWKVVYPDSPGGDDNPMMNPFVDGAPRIAGLGVRKLLVLVSSDNDEMFDRGVDYVEQVKNSGWGGDVELVEYKGDGHCFNLFNPDCDDSEDFISRLVYFIR